MLPEVITLDYLTKEKEGQYLDRKSARIKPSKIAKHLVAFSNANGGLLVIGIEDNGEVTGFNYQNAHSINKFSIIPYTDCIGNIKVKYKERKVSSIYRDDKVLLFFIEPSDNAVVKAKDEKFI